MNIAMSKVENNQHLLQTNKITCIFVNEYYFK